MNRLTSKILIIFIIIFILMLFINVTNVLAADDINTEDYKTTLRYRDTKEVFDKGAKVIKVLRNIAAIISVIVITIIGVRYMLGSVEEKAQYKETMIPVVIACILITGTASILILIQSVF